MIDFADVAITERRTPPQWPSDEQPCDPPSLFMHMVNWDAVAAKFIQEQTQALVKSLDAQILATLPAEPSKPPPKSANWESIKAMFEAGHIVIPKTPPYTIYDCLDR